MSQPAGAPPVDLLLTLGQEATGRLVAAARALSDAQAREPSSLSGWSRGHVLTHVARNADALQNLLTWAETGVQRSMYPSAEYRAAQIEKGAERSAAELADDVQSSAAAFEAHARALSAAAWRTEVTVPPRAAHQAWSVLHRRLFEVEVHHVDLATGYRPNDWPDMFVAVHLARICGELTGRPDAPAAVLADAASGQRYDLRPDLTSKVLITGPGNELLGWLLGRDDGASLSADPAGPLPAAPPYR